MTGYGQSWEHSLAVEATAFHFLLSYLDLPVELE